MKKVYFELIPGAYLLRACTCQAIGRVATSARVISTRGAEGAGGAGAHGRKGVAWRRSTGGERGRRGIRARGVQGYVGAGGGGQEPSKSTMAQEER